MSSFLCKHTLAIGQSEHEQRTFCFGNEKNPIESKICCSPIEAKDSTIELKTYLPVEVEHLTVESKIDSPVEAKDSTVELKIYLPVETKHSTISYQSVERNKSLPKDRVNVQRKGSLELTMKRRKVREREPSRIPIRKVLYAFLKKRFRKKIRIFIVRNVPNSSRLYYLCKNFRRWWLKIDKVNFDCNYIFPSSLAKPKHCQNKVPCMYEVCDNRLQVKSTKDSSQDIQKESFQPSQLLKGGMDLQTVNLSTTDTLLNSSIMRLTERLALIGLKPLDVGGQGDCFFKSVSHQIHGNANLHYQIRMAGIRHLTENIEHYIQSLTNETWENYILRMSTAGTWCDNLVIQAVANALNCVIYIVQSYMYIQSSQPITITPQCEEREYIRYITTGYLTGLHYVSTVHLNESTSNLQNKQHKNRLYTAKKRSFSNRDLDEQPGSMKVIIAYSTKQMKMYFIKQKQSYFRQKLRRPDMNQANEDLHNKCIIKLK